MATLKLYYYGLCAFVADKEFPGESRMSAVLVDASDPSRGHDGAIEHAAALYYRKDGEWKTEPLRRVEVKVNNPGAGERPLRARAQPLPKGEKPSEVDNSWRAIWWLASMRQIHRTASELKNSVLIAPGGSPPVSSEVAARVRMEKGDLRLADLGRYKGNFFTWTFLPTPQGHAIYKQALAMKVLWELELEDNNAEIVLTSLDTGREISRLSILPNAEGQVDIIIGNLSVQGREALFSVGSAVGQVIDSDLDFQWFFRLSETPPVEPPIPVPEPAVFGKTAMAIGLDGLATADAIGGGPVRCPQALFSSHSDA